MKHFDELSEKEKGQLLKFPAYISLLASTAQDGIDKQEMDAAIKLTHTKTFSCNTLLADYYREADNVFEKVVTTLDKALPHNKTERALAICHELAKLDPLIRRLDPGFAQLLRHSMESYKVHVSKAHRNVLEYFIFPLPIGGITD